MLSSEDLVELGTELRAAGFKLATYQYFSAQQLSLHLAANGMSDRRRLATYLGPIFCTTAAEQRRFAGLFDDWLARRFPGTVPAIERSGPVSPAPAKLGYSRLHWKLVIAAAALLLGGRSRLGTVADATASARFAAWSSSAGQPIADATVEFGDQKLSTAADGSFHIQTTTRALPVRLKVSKQGFDSNESVAGEEYAQLRRRLYLWPRLPDLEPVSVTLKAPPPEERPKVAIEFPPTTPREPARIGEPRIIDLNQVVPPAKVWQRLIWRDVALTAAPLLLFGLWQILAWLRRPALQRLTSTTPRTVREVHLPGGVSAPTAALPLRRLAQELRRRRAVHSAELQVRATIDASLHNAGMFTPVRGSRRGARLPRTRRHCLAIRSSGTPRRRGRAAPSEERRPDRTLRVPGRPDSVHQCDDREDRRAACALPGASAPGFHRRRAPVRSVHGCIDARGRSAAALVDADDTHLQAARAVG